MKISKHSPRRRCNNYFKVVEGRAIIALILFNDCDPNDTYNALIEAVQHDAGSRRARRIETHNPAPFYDADYAIRKHISFPLLK